MNFFDAENMLLLLGCLAVVGGTWLKWGTGSALLMAGGLLIGVAWMLGRGGKG